MYNDLSYQECTVCVTKTKAGKSNAPLTVPRLFECLRKNKTKTQLFLFLPQAKQDIQIYIIVTIL